MYVMSVRGCVMYVKHVMYVAYVTFVMYVMERGAITQCKRRIADTSQVTARPSSQLAHMLRAQARKLECGRHRNLGAHCKRRIIIASQVALRASSQLARTLQAQSRQRIASCGSTVIATWVHIAIINHRIIEASQIAARPSSQLVRTLLVET